MAPRCRRAATAEYVARELDIEYGTWASGRGDNAQLTVQPGYGPPVWYNATNQRTFFVGNSGQTHHVISWKKGQVGQAAAAAAAGRCCQQGLHVRLAQDSASSRKRGPAPAPAPQVVLQSSQHGRQVSSFTYTGKYSQWAPGDERVHMNFWMFRRTAPPREMEMVLDCFWFCPSGAKGDQDCIGRRC